MLRSTIRWRRFPPIAGRRVDGAINGSALPLTRWLNEVQMFLHCHRANARREAAGLPAVNSLWLWGGGSLPGALAPRYSAVFTGNPLAIGCARAAGTRNIPPRVVWQLEQQGLHPLLARLYAARGITDKSELDYELKSLLPPAALTHATDAAVLLADAIEAEARLLIVADYDCDGATACAVGMRALRAIGADVDYLVPNRFATATACRRKSSTSPHNARPT
jgi:hypothetical protein